MNSNSNHSFPRFKEKFECLSYSKIEDLEIPAASASSPVLRESRDMVIKLCEESLQKGFVRGDYKELVKLTLIYLNSDQQSFNGFIKPGAMHKARWMSKIIYSIKIVLLQRQISTLPKGSITTPAQVKKLRRFVEFVVYCYVPWWLTANIPADAPANDVQMVNVLLKYKEVDKDVATAVLKALSGQAWYLSQELVPLSLFSSTIDNAVKTEIVQEMLKHPVSRKLKQRHGTEFGKPVFPLLPDAECSLINFVGEDCWGFFRILKIDPSFLEIPVSNWHLNASYLDALKVVLNLCVVNDAAERGVKLCSDFLDTARKEVNLQNILQVVENNRNKIPDQRKRKLSPKNWYLTYSE